MTTQVIKKRIFTALSLMSWCVRNFLGSIYMYIVVSKVKNKNKRRNIHTRVETRFVSCPIGAVEWWPYDKKKEKKNPNNSTRLDLFCARSWPVGITGIVGWVVSVEIISKVIFLKK